MHTQNKSTAAGHTAGPWVNGWNRGLTGPTTAPTAYFCEAQQGISQLPIAKGDCAIAWVLRSGPATDEDRANAKLLASAPELLEALEAICARIHGDFDHPALAAFGPLLNTEADIMSIASTALARAKGVQS